MDRTQKPDSNETNAKEKGELWQIGDEVPVAKKKDSSQFTTQGKSHTDEKGDR